MSALHAPARQRIGFWLGVLGVALFAITLPATRLATGSAQDPQLAPLFVTVGRAATAGLLSLAFLLATRSPWPERRHWRPLLGAVAGNVVGYPLLLALALRSVTATHAAVVTALRVSQVQLLQPFLSMLFALPLLGERLDAASIGFAAAVVATVVLGRRVSRPAASITSEQGATP